MVVTATLVLVLLLLSLGGGGDDGSVGFAVVGGGEGSGGVCRACFVAASGSWKLAQDHL